MLLALYIKQNMKFCVLQPEISVGYTTEFCQVGINMTTARVASS